MHDRTGITASVEELVKQRGRAATVHPKPSARVRTPNAGAYASPFRGRGMDFDESRIYQPGDDLRSIDWRVTARTGRVHTKLYHEERERPVLVVVDERPPMRFGTRDSFKSVLAARAAAALAWGAHDAGDRVGGVILTANGPHEIAPHRSQGRLLALLRAFSESTAIGLETAADGTAGATDPVASATAAPGDASLAAALARLERVRRPGTLLFLLSDFHDLDADCERALVRLSAASEVACILVYDGLEAESPASSGYRVSDGRRVLRLSGHDRRWREQYAARFTDRRARLEALCRRRGMALLALRTGDDCAEVLRADRLARAFGVRFRGRASA